MNNVKIITDSAADLPQDLQDMYDISILPLHMHWEGKEYLDRVNIQPTEFYERMAAGAPLPTTSQVTVAQFVELVRPFLEAGRQVFYTGLSGGVSATFNSAQIAKQELGNPEAFQIVDSQTSSLATCFKLLEAAKVIAEGGDAMAAVKAVEGTHSRVGTFFTVATLEYLHRGGRINTAKRIFGSALQIKPIMWMNKEDGKIDLLESVVSRKKAINRMVELMVKEAAGRKVLAIGVEHALAPDEAAEMEAKAVAAVNPASILRADLSPMVGAHVGPGTLNLAFICE
ncbi:MAG TPA: DegV family protein [Anaerolineaceae bacterium]|nr:DegV family protein [Anaerolineaceae bacterium]